MPEQSWFELYIKRYNKLVENMVFNDMIKSNLKIACFTVGPFKEK